MLGMLKKIFLRKRVGKSNEKPVSKAGNVIVNEPNLMTPGGLKTIVSVSVGDVCVSEIEKVDRSLLGVLAIGEEEKGYQCGHSGPRRAEFILFGDQILFKGQQEIDSSEMCPDCLLEELKATSLQCCLCGCPILPHASVAVYNPSMEGINKEWARYVERGVVGCLRPNCCPTTGFYAGKWTGLGFEWAFPEGRCVADEAMAKEGIVVKNF